MSWLSNFRNDSNRTDALCDKSEEFFILWSSVTTLSFVLTFPGGFAVLLYIFQRARQGAPFTPIDVFVINLAVMDGIYLLFIEIQLTFGQDESNVVFQKFISFLFSFSLCGRPLFITCICLDCYLAVVHPITYRRRKSLTPRLLMTGGVWTVSVAYGCYLAIGRINDFNVATFLFYFLTLPVIGFCDISIVWTLKRPSPGQGKIHPQKKKALQIIANNFVITLISYLPVITAFLVSELIFLSRKTFYCYLVIPLMCVTMVGTTISVMLYLNNLGKLDWLKCWRQK